MFVIDIWPAISDEGNESCSEAFNEAIKVLINERAILHVYSPIWSKFERVRKEFSANEGVSEHKYQKENTEGL